MHDASGNGTVSGSATITVNPTPHASITGPASVALGQPLTLSTASGFASYQWFLDGRVIAGATSNTYSVSALTSADLGAYTVRVSSGSCSATSAPFIVTLSNDAILAVVGQTRGANGADFKSALVFFNPTSVPLTGEIRFIANGTTINTLAYSIPPGATQYITDFLPAGFSGLATATIVPNGELPMIIAHVFNDNGPGAGTAGMSQEPISVKRVAHAGDRGVLIAPADPVATRFNVGVRTLEAGARLRVVLRNAAGNVLTTVERTYSATSLTHSSASDLLGRAAGASDSLTFELLEGAAIIYGTPTDNGTNDPNIQFAAPLVAADAVPTQHVIAVAGSTRGGFGSLFKTGVQLHNPTASELRARFTFRLMGASAAPGDPSREIVVAPFATYSVDDLIADMGQTGLGTIDLFVTSTMRPIAVVRVFNDGERGETSMTEALLRTAEAVQAGQSASLLAPHDVAKARFNIGIRALTQAARLTATVRNRSGAIVRTTEVTVASNALIQTSAASLLGTPFTGGESVTFTVEEGAAFVYGVWTDNVTQDPTFHFAH
jgi:hypothetical protein